MGRKKQAEGTQRTARFNVRFRPQVYEAIDRKRAEVEAQTGKRVSRSELLRMALWAFCKPLDDPRVP